MQKWLEDNKEGMSVVTVKFVKTLKAKIYQKSQLMIL